MTNPARTPSPLLLFVAALFVATLVTSNIIAGKVVQVAPLGFTHVPLLDHAFTVTGAIAIFPLAYLFGDVLTEVWGYATTRAVIWTGFACNAIVVAFIAAAIALPAAPAYPDQAAYARILGTSWRLVLASFSAYLVGEFLNAYVLARLKVATRGRFLWMRTIGSTLVGQLADTAIFASLAFAGTLPAPVIGDLIRDVWIVKVAYEVVATPLTYAIVGFLKRHEGVDAFDRDTSFAPLPLTGVRARVLQASR